MRIRRTIALATTAAAIIVVSVAVVVIARSSGTTSQSSGVSAPKSSGPDGLAGFPGPSNTGVPAGTKLTNYDGPCTITTPDTVIDSKRVTCDDLRITTSGVKITRSKTTRIDADGDGVSIAVEDSEIDGGTWDGAAVGFNNLTLKRVNVHGARVSVGCGSNCEITDSWLHGQYMPPNAPWHVNGYISNGGSSALIKHNTIACDVPNNDAGGGCTGPAASFGDFAPLHDITYDGNLFVATPGGFCLAAGYDPGKSYGSDPTGIVVKNNVFMRGPNGKCGSYGPATSFLASGPGNVWSNNKWSDGSSMPAP